MSEREVPYDVSKCASRSYAHGQNWELLVYVYRLAFLGSLWNVSG